MLGSSDLFLRYVKIIKMEFLNLERGDKDNLEGRVVVYCKPDFRGLKDIIDMLHQDILGFPSGKDLDSYMNSDPNMIIAMYGTSNIVEFKEKFSGQLPLDFEEMMKEREDSYKSKFKEDNVKFETQYCGVFVTNAEGLKSSGEDLVFTGKFSDPRNFRAALMSAFEFYMANYREQRQLKSGYKKSKKESKDSVLSSDFVPYSNVNENMKMSHLQSNYIGPILHNLESGQLEKAVEKSQELIIFCQDTPLEDDAYSIARVLNLDKPEHRPHLTYLYFSKISAIILENYKDAATHNSEIKSFYKKITQNKEK